MLKTVVFLCTLFLFTAGCGQEAGNIDGAVEEEYDQSGEYNGEDGQVGSEDKAEPETPEADEEYGEEDGNADRSGADGENEQNEKNEEADMTDYTVLDHKSAAAYPEVKSYLSRLVQNTDLKGYRTFEVSDGWVLVVSTGMRPTGGFSLHVDDVEHTESGVTVLVREKKPEPGAMVTQALTNPAVALHFHNQEVPESITVRETMSGEAFPHWQESAGTEEM
ncbi:protease complex subunit PrcB family protein [Alteribacter natronophilus]|uniref:protease complex subunit PrcB family protein n=1 Tax=Alteribacter natronophilus TaxID=2583810 RepID=UPI00110D8FEB|nr:protease complex subunit PrcB family protein [Alteribacter natronophilus]TMW73809.1 protease complex subunit PrcB family protein [Alteribacter natronophilus]